MKTRKLKKSFLLFGIVLIIAGLSITFALINQDYKNPDKVIENLYQGIEYSESQGNYDCCIEPACTMCYLGHWKFEKGTCECDDAIAEGRDDDVCPECKKEQEKGNCESSDF